MKVLILHNRYQSKSPSGENKVVESETDLLREAGVQVVTWTPSSDELHSVGARVRALPGPIASPRGVRHFQGLIEEQRPDVVHAHNLFPLISPAVIRIAARRHIPVVHTVHNYRQTCVAGTHFRDGRMCEDCLRHSVPWPAVAHACYRGSRAQSGLMAAGQVAHAETWRLVSRYLITSPAMRPKLGSLGIPDQRITWRPNYAEDVGFEPVPGVGPVIFVGRLDAPKGVELLLRAWTRPVVAKYGRLVVAGDGPLRDVVVARAQQDPSVEWLGNLTADGVQRLLRQSRLIVLPSVWLEGFPRVAAEAMSAGRPVVMFDVAGFSALAKEGVGWSTSPSAAGLTRLLLDLKQADLEAAARRARLFYEQHCSPQAAISQLSRVYAEVIAEKSSPPGAP